MERKRGGWEEGRHISLWMGEQGEAVRLWLTVLVFCRRWHEPLRRWAQLQPLVRADSGLVLMSLSQWRQQCVRSMRISWVATPTITHPSHQSLIHPCSHSSTPEVTHPPHQSFVHPSSHPSTPAVTHPPLQLLILHPCILSRTDGYQIAFTYLEICFFDFCYSSYYSNGWILSLYIQTGLQIPGGDELIVVLWACGFPWRINLLPSALFSASSSRKYSCEHRAFCFVPRTLCSSTPSSRSSGLTFMHVFSRESVLPSFKTPPLLLRPVPPPCPFPSLISPSSWRHLHVRHQHQHHSHAFSFSQSNLLASTSCKFVIVWACLMLPHF